MADRKLTNAKVLAYGSIVISLCSLVVLVVAVNTGSTLFLIVGITFFLAAGLFIASAFSLRERDMEKRIDKIESRKPSED